MRVYEEEYTPRRMVQWHTQTMASLSFFLLFCNSVDCWSGRSLFLDQILNPLYLVNVHWPLRRSFLGTYLQESMISN